MDSDIFLFTSFYALVSFGFVVPPAEFISAGLTIECLFDKWLGSETEQFVQYHIQRSNVTLFCHSCLLLGYLLGLSCVKNLSYVFFEGETLWILFVFISIYLPFHAAIHILFLKYNRWKFHPIVKKLYPYCDRNTEWQSVASNINIEFRRIDKICLKTSTITKVIATDNWLIKVKPYSIDCAYQSDSVLMVIHSDTHDLAADGPGGAQFVTIEVKTVRRGTESFTIRVNATDFTDLQNKVIRPIRILNDVVFHRTLLDRFLDEFKNQINDNPSYTTSQDVDQCIGCLQNRANIKLVKLCENLVSNNPDACGHCYCRPMWCVDCMGKWFASRQDQNRTDTWLSSKCTCPMCRARFCILDICLLDQ